MMFVVTWRKHALRTSRQNELRDLFFLNKHGGRMWWASTEVDGKNGRNDSRCAAGASCKQRGTWTLDGLCFRGEQLARQVARLVTANVIDSSILNCLIFAYEKLTFCSQGVQSEETGYRAALLNSGGRGRPSYQISREQLVYFLRERFSRRKVADMLRVSLSTVARTIW